MKKLFSLLLTFALLFSLGVTALADSKTETVTINYRAIKIVVNGQAITPADATGAAVEPFIYNGSTYLPVRAVAGALGLDVAWDAATSTVTLSSGAQAAVGSGEALASTGAVKKSITYRDIKIVIDGETVTPTDATGTLVEPFIMDGTTYLPVRAVAGALGAEVGWDAATSTVTLSSGGSSGDALSSYRLVKETRYWLSDIVGKRIDVVTYTYDEGGNLIEERTHYGNGEPDVGTRYSYDSAGHMLTSEEFSGEYNFNLTTYTYDSAGHMTKAVTTMGSTLVGAIYYSYDNAGLLIEEEIVSGFLGTDGVKTYSYNEKGLLVEEQHVYPKANISKTITYSYNEAGLLLSRNNSGSITSYSYDNQGRLISTSNTSEDDELTVTYVYDENSNLVTKHSDAKGTYLDCRAEYEYEKVN